MEAGHFHKGAVVHSRGVAMYKDIVCAWGGLDLSSDYTWLAVVVEGYGGRGGGWWLGKREAFWVVAFEDDRVATRYGRLLYVRD